MNHKKITMLQGRSTRYAYIVLTLLTADRHGATSDAVVGKAVNTLSIRKVYLLAVPACTHESYTPARCVVSSSARFHAGRLSFICRLLTEALLCAPSKIARKTQIGTGSLRVETLSIVSGHDITHVGLPTSTPSV